jgi:hypothetical protein
MNHEKKLTIWDFFFLVAFPFINEKISVATPHLYARITMQSNGVELDWVLS